MIRKKKMNCFNKIGIFLLALMIVGVNLLPVIPATAADRKGSITFNFEGISDAEFRIYKVAAPDGKGGFTPTEDFKDYSVDLFETTAAETLQYYVRRDQVDPLKTARTDSNGQIFFDDLEEGVYLILGDRFERENKIYYPQPVMVSIPSKDGKNKLIWDLIVNAKYTECVKPTPPNKTTIHVQKIWDDKANPDRPESIVVQLLKGNEVQEEVTLTRENNWSYTWRDLDASADWSVVEKTRLEDYHVVISKMANGTTFVIINKKPCTPPDEPTTEGTTQERPTTEATTEGTTQDRPTTEATTEGTTQERPTTEATTEGTTQDRPTTEATTEGTTQDRPTTEATTEGTTQDRPTTEATTEGTTQDRPTTEATTEGTTQDRPTTEATTESSESTTEVEPTTETPENTTEKNHVPPRPNGGGGNGGGGSRLPQTGQLWWPVNILLCTGMLSIIIGIKVGRKKEDEE